ncbi:2TM domain-containing protein [Amycolatopsis sp. K13G38]|uniref:2TM domain-containing protein n=1 Tax=Amycolatopsis acididurans TaxID=2724524 RepID=A0ABX1IWE2_9PSEU|nr:2TM domain-containing protein [Amycolatopsis acididurans]NKQ51810.1 2TM domain-containing protein [Amycolatopsis acididurans]
MTDKPPETDLDPRAQAVERLKKKREYFQHLAIYVLTNGFLVLIWWLVGGGGFFWPIFPIGAWGIGLLMHTWDVFAPSHLSEERIRREMRRQS